MGHASVDVVAVTACTTGKPQLKSKLLRTFSDGERNRNSFENSISDDYNDANTDINDDYYYYNTKGINCEQGASTAVPRSHLTQGNNEGAAFKRLPFILPTITLELTQEQQGNGCKTTGALLPDWQCDKEQMIYENSGCASVREAKSTEQFRTLDEQPLYVNNNQLSYSSKQHRSVEDFSKHHLTPELPLKKGLPNPTKLGQTKTWQRNKTPDYENFFGGDAVGGSRGRGAFQKNNTNGPHLVGQAAKVNHLNDGKDYENLPPNCTTGKFLPQKMRGQDISTSCDSLVAQKAALLESHRRNGGIAREDRKAVRRSKINFEAMPMLPQKNRSQSTWQEGGRHRDGRIVFKSRENLSENHQTNTESLMHMLGLRIDLNCPDQVKTFQDDDFLPTDDYDDNCT
jgi:hypothetical protein